MTMLAAWLAPGLDRIEQAAAAQALVVLELKRQLRKQARFVPPGFVPLALAGFLFVVGAGVQESRRERGRPHLGIARPCETGLSRTPLPSRAGSSCPERDD